MAVQVKLRCSECQTLREELLKPDEKEIFCPVCGRRMANLPAEDHAELEKMQKSQRLLSIIAIALFVFALVCVVFWVNPNPQAWISGKVVGPDGTLADAPGMVEANIGAFIGAIVCTLASVVLGVMASMKRFVVEF